MTNIFCVLNGKKNTGYNVQSASPLFYALIVIILLSMSSFASFPTQTRGYDLRGEWKFSSKDNLACIQNSFDDSSWDKVKLPESRKSLTVGWYRYKISLPDVKGKDSEFLGTEILIGNIEGNSAVYFNGHLLGQTRGSGNYSDGRPQDYVVVPNYIHFGGENLIAIRVTGLGGGEGIGITGTPLALAPLGDSYLYQKMHTLEDQFSELLCRYANFDMSTSKAVRQIRDINKKLREARVQQGSSKLSSLAQNLKELESAIPKADEKIRNEKMARLHQDEDVPPLPDYTVMNQGKFGMLGRLYNDGLLLFNSSPAGFDYKYGADAPYSVRYRGITPQRISISRMNWITKTMHIDGKKGNKDVSYDVTHSSVFPGILVNVNDNEFSFTYTNSYAKTPDYMGYVSERHATIYSPVNPKLKRNLTKINLNVDKGNLPMVNNWLVFWSTGRHGAHETFPLLVAFEKQLNEISYKEDEDGVTVITIKSKGLLGHMVFIYPFGMQGIEGQKADYLLRGFPKEFIDPCNFWGAASLQFPIDCSEQYWVNDKTQKVDILDEFKYMELQDNWDIGRINMAPIPPVLAHAVVHDYPVTFTGPGTNVIHKDIQFSKIYPGLNMLMRTKYGEYGAMVGVNKVQYQLPIPPWEENTTHTLFGKGVGIFNDFVTKSESEVNDKNKARLWANATTAPLKAFDPDLWSTRIEPFSGATYDWTNCQEGPYNEMYDIDYGNGLAIYGFQKYAQYNGDSKSIKENWEKIKKANRYFEIGDSWTWMAVGNADSGQGTGTGDCLNIDYVSALAMAKMAKQLGEESTYQAAVFRAAKSAVPMLTRFWMNDYAKENKMISEDKFVIGYLEDDGILAVSKNDNPSYLTSVISGYGVEPEVFELYMKYDKDILQGYENQVKE